MRLTIIPSDSCVYYNNVSYAPISMSGVPSDVHALQWNNNVGWIEFNDNPDGSKPANQPITELPQWALDLIPLWEAMKAEAEAGAVYAAQNQPTSQGAQNL